MKKGLFAVLSIAVLLILATLIAYFSYNNKGKSFEQYSFEQTPTGLEGVNTYEPELLEEYDTQLILSKAKELGYTGTLVSINLSTGDSDEGYPDFVRGISEDIVYYILNSEKVCWFTIRNGEAILLGEEIIGSLE